jgi:long-chain-fatty-acid--CoA ligase ACSBG
VDESVVTDIIDSVTPSDVACYIYTSGTTGNPKAVMITHDNICFQSFCALSLLPETCRTGEQRAVSYLPLSHVAGCMVDIVMPLVVTATTSGYVIAGFARVYDLSKSTIGDRLRCIKPTLFLGVPRVWEKIADKIKKAGAAKPDNVKKFSAFCKAQGLSHATNCQLGGSGEHPPWYKLANKVVFSNVKGLLGLSECTFAFTGAAPISEETLSYYGSLGLQVNEVYGMSECTGATTWSTDQAHVWGSCGFAMPGCEVKVFKNEGKEMVECPQADDIFNPTEANQGEICFRGRHIMAGYLANPSFGEEHMETIKQKNADAIDANGWLHSGDKGVVGTNGMFKITGRYKELLIGSGGENIAPVPIENHIKKLCPAISNIMMVGDKKKYNTALVTLKCVGASGYLPGTSDLDSDAQLFGCSTTAEASSSQEYIDMIKEAITTTNNEASVVPSRACKIQKFTILPTDFSTETNELTPTLKLKRGFTASMEKYQEVIERLYAPGAPDYVPFVGSTIVSSDNLKVEIPEGAPDAPNSPLLEKN